MADWLFRVPPDIAVTLRAAKQPSLLMHALGEETAPHSDATLVLDLGGAIDESAPVERGHYKSIPWRHQVATDGGRRTIVFQSPVLREYLALHIALLPALRQLLLERDSALVVGASCSSGDGATLLAGETGAGKTAALLVAAERGARLIGDEYVGVSASGDVTPVVRVIALRRRTLAGAPEIARRLSAQRRVALLVAALAARVSFGRLDPLVHAAPSELGLAPAADRARRISTFVWIERNGPHEPRPMSVTDAVEALLRVQQAHDRAYGITADADAVRWCDVLSRGLSGVRCLRAGAPLAPQMLAAITSGGRQETATRP